MIKSVYIHIPFCKNICHYCDFAKLHYHSNWVIQYLEELKKEILLEYKKDKIDTLYIGGGTPNCLSIDEFQYLFEMIHIFQFNTDYEFTVECNIEDLNLEKIRIMKKAGVNRVSLGVQTLQDKYLKLCNRKHNKEMVKKVVSSLKEEGITNINFDLMYGFPDQTVEDVKKDLMEYMEFDISHISTYSLMIEPHTVFYHQGVKNIAEEVDAMMYELINQFLKENYFQHYEISNFSKEGYQSRHNLTYWNNEEYYGFGLGASSYVGEIRKTNTRHFKKYSTEKKIEEMEKITDLLKLEYEFILGFRKIEGIHKATFYEKYHMDMIKMPKVEELLKKGDLKQNKEYIFIPEEKLYTSNEILLNFIS